MRILCVCVKFVVGICILCTLKVHSRLMLTASESLLLGMIGILQISYRHCLILFSFGQ